MSGIKKQVDSKAYISYVARQYGKNKIAVVSLYFILFFVFLAIFADFLANEKPIVAKYNGRWITPILNEYSVGLGITKWPSDLQNVDWKELDYKYVTWPPIRYLPSNIDLDNNHSVSPLSHQNVSSLKWRHWLGTDELGRDVLAGLIHATRISLSVGIIAMSIATFIGVILGAFAGFFGDDRFKISRISLILLPIVIFLGFFYSFATRHYHLADALGSSFFEFFYQLLISLVIFSVIVSIGYLITRPLKKFKWLAKRIVVPIDLVVSRVIEIVVTIPTLILIVSIVAIAKPSIYVVMIVVGLTTWTGIARFIRAELLKVRNLEYIEAAKALGYSQFRTLIKHAIPNTLSPVLIAIAFGIAAAILIEATLSFLGLGIPSDTVTWGSLLNLGRTKSEAWWLVIFPGFAIFLTVTVFNLIGEGLTDATDPRLKR